MSDEDTVCIALASCAMAKILETSSPVSPDPGMRAELANSLHALADMVDTQVFNPMLAERMIAFCQAAKEMAINEALGC